jgi:hypothetical protein
MSSAQTQQPGASAPRRVRSSSFDRGRGAAASRKIRVGVAARDKKVRLGRSGKAARPDGDAALLLRSLSAVQAKRCAAIG